VNENFSNFSNIIFFMGKSGRKNFQNTLRNWDLDYSEKKSLTNEESFLINVKKIKKKIKKN
jgi:16S rRNA (guanine527-N7)-methyltransferase